MWLLKCALHAQFRVRLLDKKKTKWQNGGGNTLFLASRNYLIVYSKLFILSTLIQKIFTKDKFSILKIAEFTLRLYFSEFDWQPLRKQREPTALESPLLESSVSQSRENTAVVLEAPLITNRNCFISLKKLLSSNLVPRPFFSETPLGIFARKGLATRP